MIMPLGDFVDDLLELPAKVGKLASLGLELVQGAMGFDTSDDYDRVKAALAELWDSVNDYDVDNIPDSLDEILENLGVTRKGE
jgi:hypothetical protein